MHGGGYGSRFDKKEDQASSSSSALASLVIPFVEKGEPGAFYHVTAMEIRNEGAGDYPVVQVKNARGVVVRYRLPVGFTRWAYDTMGLVFARTIRFPLMIEFSVVEGVCCARIKY